MQNIVTKNATSFMINGVAYPKTFLATANEDYVSLYSSGNDSSKLFNDTHYSFISVDGVVMSDAALAVEKLNEIVFTNPTTGQTLPDPELFVQKTDTVSWQKYRVTEDNGYSIQLTDPDLNNYNKTGSFFNNFTVNAPVSGSAYLEVLAANAATCLQKLTVTASGTDLTFYERRKIANIWLPWRKFERIDNSTGVPSLMSGFEPYGLGYEDVTVYRKGDICYLEGMIKKEFLTTEEGLPYRTPILQVPEEFRPTKAIILPMVGRSKTFPARMLTNGILDNNEVIPKTGSSDWFSIAMSYVIR